MIEGWHPSMPNQLGFNLMIDGDWIGTFDSLDSAAKAASREPSAGTGTKERRVTLMPLLDRTRGHGGPV